MPNATAAAAGAPAAEVGVRRAGARVHVAAAGPRRLEFAGGVRRVAQRARLGARRAVGRISRARVGLQPAWQHGLLHRKL